MAAQALDALLTDYQLVRLDRAVATYLHSLTTFFPIITAFGPIEAIVVLALKSWRARTAVAFASTQRGACG